ncbi:hypothetical protein BgAZ_300150 [Babesia gibsoni]|uniref:Uncharacterized protein n=1 Tax=Babesia gibsoni TaxID=33632 RepID=A0AAD8LQG9_BABGI|nr:hypothetical protein BgAZ_300150 [Babesia gibsoni]
MFNVIHGRLGHSVDSFAVIETDHVSLSYGPDDGKQSNSPTTESAKKHMYDEAVNYQEKIRLKEKVADVFATQEGRPPIVDDRAINAEEARQVIHGCWRAHHSEKFWNTLDREEETDFSFDGLNPATIDHYINGICKDKPAFRTGYIRHLMNMKGNTNVYDTILPTKDAALSSSRRLYSRGHNLILFGGFSPTEKQMESCKSKLTASYLLESIWDLKVLSDTCVLSMKDFTSTWKQLTTVGNPDPRAFHASTILYLDFATPVLCIAGGFGRKRQLLDMKIHMLSLIQRKNELKWMTVKTVGDVPEKRYGHTMGQVGPWLTVFGGTNGERMFNDLWVIDIDNGVIIEPLHTTVSMWVKVSIIGLVPQPRCFHASTKIGLEANNPIVIYGGITAEDTSRAYTLRLNKDYEFKWTMLPVAIRCPNEARAFHSMTYMEGHLVISGGEDFRADIPTIQKSLIYSIPTREFQYLEDSLALTGHRSCVVNGVVYHFGGLRNVCSRIYLEPIGSQKGMKDSVEMRAALEHHFLREVIKDLEAENKMNGQGKSDTEICQPDVDPSCLTKKDPPRKRTEATVTKKPDASSDVVEDPIKPKNGRPRRSAAVKCAQSMEEEIAKMKIREQEKANAAEASKSS